MVLEVWSGADIKRNSKAKINHLQMSSSTNALIATLLSNYQNPKEGPRVHAIKDERRPFVPNRTTPHYDLSDSSMTSQPAYPV